MPTEERVEVTGETIEDSHVHALRAVGLISIADAANAVSLAATRSKYESTEEFERRKAERKAIRNRCAEAWNARQGEEFP